MLNKKELGERIRELIDEKGIQAKDIAEYIGVTQAAMSNYIAGRRNIDTDTLSKIAKFLNVSLEFLIDNTNVNKVELNEKEQKLLKVFQGMSEEKQDAFLKFIESDK